VALSPYFKNLLEANGVVPVTEKDWLYIDQVQFGLHAVLGFPSEFREDTRFRRGNRVMVTAYPTLLWIDEIKDSPEINKKSYPRFVGRLHDISPLTTLSGMSGGPIFGFSEDGMKYWIVAIQSGWRESQKLVFGCLVQVFASEIERMLDDSTE